MTYLIETIDMDGNSHEFPYDNSKQALEDFSIDASMVGVDNLAATLYVVTGDNRDVVKEVK